MAIYYVICRQKPVRNKGIYVWTIEHMIRAQATPCQDKLLCSFTSNHLRLSQIVVLDFSSESRPTHELLESFNLLAADENWRKKRRQDLHIAYAVLSPEIM